MTTEQNDQMHALMDVLSKALKEFDDYTRRHSQTVSDLNVQLATHLSPGWSLEEFQGLAAGGALHDIGKLAVPRGTLNGTTSHLSNNEWSTIYGHPLRGVEIVTKTGLYVPTIVRECIEYHHERWDGRQDCERPGYPHGLKGESIPISARITAVSDTWDAITSDRTYQLALPTVEAVKLLQSLAGNRLDPKLVKLFIEKVVSSLAS
jgi:HD-GYP domain-containing protein (c-di-GMP phosphodiesterase class II)